MERAISERENNPGTPVFAHYTSARRWYAPHDLAKVNNSEIERVTEMDKKKLLLITDSCIIQPTATYLIMYQDFECPHLNFLIFLSSFIEERGTQTDPLLVQDPEYPDAHHQHHHHGVQQDLSRTTIQNQSGASLANVVSPPSYPPPGQVARKKVTRKHACNNDRNMYLTRIIKRFPIVKLSGIQISFEFQTLKSQVFRYFVCSDHYCIQQKSV